MMENFFWLIFAHSLADFSLQTSWMAEYKAKSWYVMLIHCLVWTGCISAVLKILGLLSLWKILFLFLGHYFLDTLKIKVSQNQLVWKYFYLDQLGHFLQLIVVYLL